MSNFCSTSIIANWKTPAAIRGSQPRAERGPNNILLANDDTKRELAQETQIEASEDMHALALLSLMLGM